MQQDVPHSRGAEAGLIEAYALLGLLSQKGQNVEAKMYADVGHAFIPPGKDEPDLLTVMGAVGRTTKFLGTHMKKEVEAK
jgi:hypothetical protein